MVEKAESPWRERRNLFVGAVALATVLLAPAVSTAELNPSHQRARNQFITSAVTHLLDRQHLLRRDLDDEVSQRAFQTFLKQLDPMKVYFYQSDIAEFERNKQRLDDQVKRGDLGFAYAVFNRFLKRLDERVAEVPGLLAQQHDFDLKEELVTDPDVAEYAKSPAEAVERWRKRIKYDLLLLKDDDVEGEEAVDRLTRRYRSYAKRMKQYRADDLLEIYLTAITTAFDPHTTYMSPTTLENFNIQMKLNLDGIGAALQMEDGYTVVSRVIPGGAAAKQGELKPEDRIVSVAQGKDGEFVDVIDMRLNDVVQQIRGKAGTLVRLGVKSSDGESKVVSIVRDRIELKDAEARGEIISSDQFSDVKKANGAPYRIGVIKLPSFYMDMAGAKRRDRDFKSTTRDVRRILNDFRRQGIDGLVLDLRFNGGGSLTEAIDLTGLFIDYGPVVQVKDFFKNVHPYEDELRGTLWDGPLTVVTNKFSASASEILAGAIQDYKRGIVIGDKTTHGKGTVQSLLDLRDRLFPNMPNTQNLGALKITMQQFYRPNGDSTQKRGVLADVPLPSTTSVMDIGEADLDYAVEFGTVPVAPHLTYSSVTPEILKRLNGNVQQRLASSDDFARELRRIERYKEQKERDFVSLNEEEFFNRRKELNAEKEDEETSKEAEGSDEKVIDAEDFYDKEILSVTLDYVQLLSHNAAPAVVATPDGSSR